ncbi:MAG: CPBP family intramembrane metalloprotease [Oligoflexia bacterium]|nr:CPBP family intramembrane metalloprotease [Oligoflexia bacterium]
MKLSFTNFKILDLLEGLALTTLSVIFSIAVVSYFNIKSKYLGYHLDLISPVLIAPFEEIIFRHHFLKYLTKKFNLFISIFLSSILFMIFHYDLFGSLVFSIVMTFLYFKYKSITVPILCHAFNNLIGVIDSILFMYNPKYNITCVDIEIFLIKHFGMVAGGSLLIIFLWMLCRFNGEKLGLQNQLI